MHKIAIRIRRSKPNQTDWSKQWLRSTHAQNAYNFKIRVKNNVHIVLYDGTSTANLLHQMNRINSTGKKAIGCFFIHLCPVRSSLWIHSCILPSQTHAYYAFLPLTFFFAFVFNGFFLSHNHSCCSHNLWLTKHLASSFSDWKMLEHT